MKTMQKVLITGAVLLGAAYAAMSSLTLVNGGTPAILAPKDITGYVREVSPQGYFTVPLGKTDFRISVTDVPPEGLESIISPGEHVKVTDLNGYTAANIDATVLNTRTSLHNIYVAADSKR